MPTVHVRLDAQQNALWKQLAAAYGQLPGSFARAKLVDVLQHARMEGPDFLLSDPDFTLPRKGRTRKARAEQIKEIIRQRKAAEAEAARQAEEQRRQEEARKNRGWSR